MGVHNCRKKPAPIMGRLSMWDTSLRDAVALGRGAMTTFDTDGLRWMVVSGDGSTSYRMHPEISILGYDRDAGTLDMIMRFDNEGGHCPAHRHLISTSILVLEGEQHVMDMDPAGDSTPKLRRAGEYHLTTGDPCPHMERGGPDGAVVFFGHHTTDGRLYDLVDEGGNVLTTVTVDSLVAAWNASAS